MSKSGFFNKVPGQSIFRGQQVIFCHGYVSGAYIEMPIAAIFLHSFYSIVNYLRGALCHGPTLADLLQKLDRVKEKTYFC